MKASYSDPTTEEEVGKAGLARWYRVGPRTIENWIAKKLIVGRREGNKLYFIRSQCDRALLSITEYSKN